VSLLNSEFWREEGRKLWDLLSELVLIGYLMGAGEGASLLPASIAPLVDWDFINESAITYLRKYRLEWIPKMEAVTRRQTLQALEGFLREGHSLETLKERLRATALSPHRADRIAITEVTRMLAAGNLDAWRSTGVVTGKRWFTAQDERVCVICGRLHGRIVEIDQGWTFMPEDLAGEENAELRRALGNVDAITILQPPAHVNCRCVLMPFVSVEAVGEEIERILFEDA